MSLRIYLGSPVDINCQAEGVPPPIVVLSRKTSSTSLELSRDKDSSISVLSMEFKSNTRFTSGFSWSNFDLLFFIVIFVSAFLDSVDEKEKVVFVANDVLGFDNENEGKPFRRQV